jgi:hypothetical protein
VTCARCLDSILEKCGHSAAGEQAAVASVKHLVRALARMNHAGGFPADAWQPLQRGVTILPPSELTTFVPTLLPLVRSAAESTDWHHRLAAAALLSALARWVDDDRAAPHRPCLPLVLVALRRVGVEEA